MPITNPSLIKVLQEITTNLNTHQVEYLIVGGTAVNIHGYHRISMGLPPGVDFDIDIWYKPTIENFIKLSKAIQSIGVNRAEELDKIIFDPKKTFLRLTHGNYKMEFLPFISGIDIKQFASSYQNRSNYDLNGINITVIGYDDLIASKKALSRHVDLQDVVELQKIKTIQKKGKGLSM